MPHGKPIQTCFQYADCRTSLISYHPSHKTSELDIISKFPIQIHVILVYLTVNVRSTFFHLQYYTRSSDRSFIHNTQYIHN